MTDYFAHPATKQIVDLWCGGMAMTNIARAIGLKTTDRVRRTLDAYCEREREYSRDGRSWAYKRLREVHPEAPLSVDQQRFLWPPPTEYYDGDDDADEAIGRVLNAADELNSAIAWLDGDGDGSGHVISPESRRRVVVAVHEGRVYVTIDHDWVEYHSIDS